MIKNTMEIIKKNKIIPILFGAMFVYVTLFRLLDTQIYYIFYPLINLVDDVFGSWWLGYDIVEYIVHAIGAVFLLAPAMHYIHLAVTGEKTDGFYKAGLKRNWYKSALIVTAVLILWDLVKYIRFDWAFNSMYMGFYLEMLLTYVLGITLVIFMLWLLVSMSSEPKFGTGIKNIFKSGKKYLLISTASVIVLWILNRLYNIDFYSDVNHTLFVILVMMLQAAIIMYTLTLGMNEYVLNSYDAEDGAGDVKIRGKLGVLIVKTKTTLKKYPKIFLWFLIPFVYQVINIILIRADVFSAMQIADTFRNSFYGGAIPGGKEYLTWFIGFLYTMTWLFILNPPLIYLIYLLSDNKSIKGWYKDGLKHGWWKVFVFRLICACVMMAVILLFSFIILIGGGLIFGYSGFVFVLFLLIALPLICVIGVYMAVGEATVIGEKNFGDGMKMMFKTGKAHFFRILLVFAVLSVIYIVFSLPMYSNPELLNSIWYILVSLIMSLISPVTLAFCMNCYIDIRDREAEKSECIMDNA